MQKKTKPILIHFKPGQIARIDEMATKLGMNRSEFIRLKTGQHAEQFLLTAGTMSKLYSTLLRVQRMLIAEKQSFETDEQERIWSLLHDLVKETTR